MAPLAGLSVPAEVTGPIPGWVVEESRLLPYSPWAVYVREGFPLDTGCCSVLLRSPSSNPTPRQSAELPSPESDRDLQPKPTSMSILEKRSPRFSHT